MNIKDFYKNKESFFLLLILFLGGVLNSCGEKDLYEDRDNMAVPLKAGAQIQGVNLTRTYKEAGIVEEGTFYMSYLPALSTDINELGIATVNFNNGLGNIEIEGNRYLEWTDIGNNKTNSTLSTFYLDNISPDEVSEGSDDKNIVVFKDTGERFKAGILDTENGSNDLLWGVREIARNSPIVNFELHHCMARISVELTLEEESDVLEDKEFDIDKAQVSVSNLLHTADSYNRRTGELIFTGEKSDERYQKLELVNQEYNWLSKNKYKEAGKNFTLYKSRDFVIPPQELRTDENRPRLSIRLPLKDSEESITYSGVIPRAMEMTKEDGTTVPMTLSLLREYCLTFHVRLSLNPVEIIFMPVTVQDWVDKGTVLITADQAGINNEAAFLKFLEIITAYDGKDENDLVRYGYKDSSDNWVFNIFGELIFDLNQEKYKYIRGFLNSCQLDNFSFNMHRWTITIISGTKEYKLTSSEQFIDFLIRGNLPSN